MNSIPKQKTWYFVALLVVVTTLTYLNHFDNAFHFDDFHTITENPHIRSLKNIPSFFVDGTKTSTLPQNQTYRPTVAASLAIDYWLSDSYNVSYFHLSNFLFFLLQGILIFFFTFHILTKIAKHTHNFYIAAVCSLLYMLHPVMAETVNYIIARSDIQSTFFVVLAFVLYQYSKTSKRYYLYLIPILIGTLAKPTALMFAPLFFCYYLLFESNVEGFKDRKVIGKPFQNAFKKTLPTLIFCIALFLFQRSMTPDTYTTAGGNVFNYLITQPYVLFYYFKSAFFPFSLSADTDLNPFESIWNYQFFLGLATIIFLVYVIYKNLKKKQHFPIAFGILWFFIALAPTSSVIPLAEVMNDHRMFFPYVGLLFSLVYYGYLKLETYRKGGWITYANIRTGVITILALCAFGTFQRNLVWDTEESLWKDVTIKSPKNGRGLMNYGVILMENGAYQEAQNYFLKALEFTPNYYALYNNLGILNNALGHTKQAEYYFKTAIEKRPNYYSPWYFYGRFLTQHSRNQEAIETLNKSLEITPSHMGTRLELLKNYNTLENWEALNSLAKTTLVLAPENTEIQKYLAASNNRIGKLQQLETTIDKNPDAIAYLNLSLSHYRKKNYLKCIEIAKKALELKPDYAKAYNNICASYNNIGDYKKAIIACKKALEIDPNLTIAANNLKDAEAKL